MPLASEAKIAAARANAAKATAIVKARIDARPKWRCAQCGDERPATNHQQRKVYCSKECMAVGYSIRLAGPSNPNYSRAGNRVCLTCGTWFQSYSASRKYCSRSCYTKSESCIERAIRQLPAAHAAQSAKAAAKPPKICGRCGVAKTPTQTSEYCEACARQNQLDGVAAWAAGPIKPNKTCMHCRHEFHSYQKNRLYCSYDCYLASGGARRAGEASARAVMNKYGAKKDANHRAIFDELSKHCKPVDLSNVGCGLPDGLAYIADGWRLFEVKNPKTAYGRRGLNKRQTKWSEEWCGGPIFLVYTVEEAASFGRGEFVGLRCYVRGVQVVYTAEQALEAINS